MEFKRTLRPGVKDIGVSTENTLSSSSCHDGGLTGLKDKTLDGAYQMSHRWALDHVPASQAASGLRRLHQHLVFGDVGWGLAARAHRPVSGGKALPPGPPRRLIVSLLLSRATDRLVVSILIVSPSSSDVKPRLRRICAAGLGLASEMRCGAWQSR